MTPIKIKDKLGNVVPLGVLSHHGLTGIFVKQIKTVSSKFLIIWSTDEAHYKTISKEVTIYITADKKENPKICSHFKFAKSVDGWIATYIRTEKHKKNLIIATSKDLYMWSVKSELDISTNDAALVVNATTKTNYILYLGGLFVTHAKSKDLKKWSKESGLLYTSRNYAFDSGDMKIIGATITKRGILMFYDATISNGTLDMIQAGAVLFSRDEPGKIIWRSDIPVWKAMVKVTGKHRAYPIGLITLEGRTTLFWATEDGSILTAVLATPFTTAISPPKEKPYLKRHPKNPIIAPHSENEWENEAVFNPAAIYDDGKIHLLYRAIGKSGLSVLGYASSKDGLDFTRRDEPVYEPHDGHALPGPEIDAGSRTYNPAEYASGGGWAGCEDPRAVKIGKRIYVTYLAFGGWNSMRIALTSISQKDLNNEIWKWKRPQFISPPGEIHKNWVLFPEKVKGKFAVLHSITPQISIHYADSLSEFNGKTFIKSKPPIGGRMQHWDNKVRGAGPPPIKTPAGWLLLYHANDVFDPHKYKLGAMILDTDNPEKILYRTSHPILCPDMHYENDGKPGVVYASGAIIKDDELYVYYGGGDKVVCVASSPLDSFLEKVKEDATIELNPKQPLII
ncbi:hypothetical protein KW782_00215 [Candidatus Parcubacteria bacterium]|nr:hypothetical protein [Candidatus Parcubacteria bacterium]